MGTPQPLVPLRWLTEAITSRDELEAVNAELLAALKIFAECELTEDNCASFDVANKRIRNIARQAIANMAGK